MINIALRTAKTLVFISLMIAFSATGSSAQSTQKELGIRYLKLGNTYREASDWTNAEKFIQKGLKLAGKDDYWRAVAYEYMGYVERDRAFRKSPVDSEGLRSARNYLADAYDIYNRIITMKDGSPDALASLKLQREKIDLYLSGGAVPGAGLGSGTTVNYDSQKLKEFPRDLNPGTTNLSAKDNRLKSFPYEVTRMQGLEYLNLAENKIDDLPATVGAMRNLQWLDLSGNKIKELPAELAGASSLEILDLSGNRLKDLPSAMCAMTGLKVLDISGNKIEFERIKSLIQCLPNTNIIHDKYEREEEGSGGTIFSQPAPNMPANMPPSGTPPADTPQERKP